MKLCDFGLAINEEDASRSDFVGTEGFISPEQTYLEKVTKASDVWAAGMVFATLVPSDWNYFL